MGKNTVPLGTYRGELWFCECVKTGVKEMLQERTFTWRTEERQRRKRRKALPFLFGERFVQAFDVNGLRRRSSGRFASSHLWFQTVVNSSPAGGM